MAVRQRRKVSDEVGNGCCVGTSQWVIGFVCDDQNAQPYNAFYRTPDSYSSWPFPAEPTGAFDMTAALSQDHRDAGWHAYFESYGVAPLGLVNKYR